jgi:hypothetical protein
MTLRHLALEEIGEAELQRLITGRATESRDIEYKRDCYGNADKDYGEYLSDISSFANTVGGDIIIGIDARAGVPIALSPVSKDVDAEIVRLENIARSGLQPHIFGLAATAIPIANGGSVIVIRIPRSYNLPHRIVRHGTGHHRFYARSSAGKYEPNVDELRMLFGRAPQIAERIRDFRFERLAKINANEAAASLLDNRALVLHIVPFAAFDTRLSLPLGEVRRWCADFPPILSSQPSNFRINVDGLLTLLNAVGNASLQRAYVQLFHSGIVEAVTSSFPRGDGTVESPYRITYLQTEASIVKYSHRYLRGLISLGCMPPFVLLASLIGAKNVEYSFTGATTLFDDEAERLDREQYHFSEVTIENVPEDPYEFAKGLKPLLDETANAAGRAATPSFDSSGHFRLKVD